MNLKPDEEFEYVHLEATGYVFFAVIAIIILGTLSVASLAFRRKSQKRNKG